jgi:dynein heavy chain
MLGLDGALNMSSAMEEVQNGIYRNTVPPSWMKVMSTRVQEVYSLQRWYRDVQHRWQQLDKWTSGKVEHPKTVWLPGLFNAKAFVTAVQQVYARANQLPLDVMQFMTEVCKAGPDEITEYSSEGAYIHGLSMEGARWDTKAGAYTRPLLSSTLAVLVTPPHVPLSNRLGDNHACTQRIL